MTEPTKVEPCCGEKSDGACADEALTTKAQQIQESDMVMKKGECAEDTCDQSDEDDATEEDAA